MLLLECEQRTEAWFDVRRGIPTASNFDRIFTSKGEPSKQRTDYLYKLAAQRISGVDEDSFTSAAMLAGTEREELARWVYAMQQEVFVEEVGFCLSDCGRYGASPDGLIGDDGLLELKNPIGSTHVGYLLAGTLPAKYAQQVYGQLLVTGRDWSDFVSYYPGLPMLIVRVERDEGLLAKMEAELVAFCDELDDICEKISKEA